MTRTITMQEALHHIDIEQNKVTAMPINSGSDLRDYLNGLMIKILKMPNTKHFKAKSDSTEAISLINGFMQDVDSQDFQETSLKIADRLLREEIKVQKRYGKITDVKKGSVIQSVFPSTSNRNMYYLITKVEHEIFLNARDLVKQIGMSYEQNILKTCLIEFNDENEIIDIIITDSNSKLSVYWYDEFMELIELNTNQYNTKTAFYSIEQILSRKVKKQAPSDFIVLRNNLIGYFRTQTSYKHEQMLDIVFGDYQPDVLEKEKLLELKETVNKLPSIKSFDKHFDIEVKEVKAKMRIKVPLSEKIELRITDNVDELKNVIHSEYGLDGTKQIVIKTVNEEAFNLFNFKKEG